VLDQHGQPLSLRFNEARRIERDVSELLGLAKGVLADGVVTHAEAELLRTWVGQHPDAVQHWPIGVLHERLQRVFDDGQIDDSEREDLSELLQSIVGGTAGIIGVADAATELPFDIPPPQLAWSGSIFVFTGKFAFGTRQDCQRQAASRGGHCEGTITKRTKYLVIGTFGSRDWVHTSFGRKIEKAVAYRDQGTGLAITGEDHWARSL
jgi:NAD-dependent DNA ligase